MDLFCAIVIGVGLMGFITYLSLWFIWILNVKIILNNIGNIKDCTIFQLQHLFHIGFWTIFILSQVVVWQVLQDHNQQLFVSIFTLLIIFKVLHLFAYSISSALQELIGWQFDDSCHCKRSEIFYGGFLVCFRHSTCISILLIFIFTFALSSSLKNLSSQSLTSLSFFSWLLPIFSVFW